MGLQQLEHVDNVDGLAQERREPEHARPGLGVRFPTRHHHDGEVFEAIVRELRAAEVVAVHLGHGEVEHDEAGTNGMPAKVVKGITAIHYRHYVKTHDGSELREHLASMEVSIRQEHLMKMLGPVGGHNASPDTETASRRKDPHAHFCMASTQGGLPAA